MNATKERFTKINTTSLNDKTMKAVVCTKYGSPDFLQLKTVEKPSPKDHEVLVKVYAGTVTAADTMMRRADPFISRFFLGFTKPKSEVIGTGFAGEVEVVGKAVKSFKVGDEVFGETGVMFRANAEYVCLPETGVILHKPFNMTFEDAAPICDGPLTSYNFLKKLANIQPGQSVLINGASGSLGTAAVQLAKYFGAEVTGVCSTKNLEMVLQLGADKVIDYTTTDFTQNNDTYDIIYDTVGKSTFSLCKKALKQNGIYLSPVLDLSLLFQVMWTSMFGDEKAKFAATGLSPDSELREMLVVLKEIIELGQLKTIIDKRYPLEHIAAAHKYVDKGHKKGNVILVL